MPGAVVAPQRGWRRAASVVLALFVVGAGLATSARPSTAEVEAVIASACGYYVDVGLFGGPSQLRGCGQAADAPAIGVSPYVELPPTGSAEPVIVTDPDGARAEYGPASIFAGIWPDSSATAPPSGPITVSAQGTPEGGSVTASVDIVLRDPPNPGSPGGIGPGPLIAEEVHARCTADENTAGATVNFLNGVIHTKHDVDTGEPIQTVPIPPNPEPNTAVSGTLDHIDPEHTRPGYTVVLNEQIRNADNELIVRAAHMYLDGNVAVGDMVIGELRCGAAVGTIPTTQPGPATTAAGTTSPTVAPAAGPVVAQRGTTVPTGGGATITGTTLRPAAAGIATTTAPRGNLAVSGSSAQTIAVVSLLVLGLGAFIVVRARRSPPATVTGPEAP